MQRHHRDWGLRFLDHIHQQRCHGSSAGHAGRAFAHINHRAPGYISFDGLTRVFEGLIEQKDLPGTLPYSVLPAGELTWLYQNALPITIRSNQVKGYRFANGDVAILFFIDPAGGKHGDYRAAERALAAIARNTYRKDDGTVAACIPFDNDFAYLVVSKDYASQLGRLAEMARTGEGAEALRRN